MIFSYVYQKSHLNNLLASTKCPEFNMGICPVILVKMQKMLKKLLKYLSASLDQESLNTYLNVTLYQR